MLCCEESDELLAEAVQDAHNEFIKHHERCVEVPVDRLRPGLSGCLRPTHPAWRPELRARDIDLAKAVCHAYNEFIEQARGLGRVPV